MKPVAPAPTHVFSAQIGLWDPTEATAPTLLAEPRVSYAVDDDVPDTIPNPESGEDLG